MEPRPAANWQARLFTEMDETQRQWATSNIVRVGDNLNRIYESCAERAIKLLTLINSGGIITVLAYIYRPKGDPTGMLLSISLMLFVIGLMCILDVVARDYDFTQNISLRFNEDVQHFLLGEIPFADIRQFQIRENVIDEEIRFTVKLGKCSGYLAVMGIFFGLLGYFFS